MTFNAPAVSWAASYAWLHRDSRPVEQALETDTGTMVEGIAGDTCSALGIIGAATLLAARKLPHLDVAGEQLVHSSMAAAAVDTTIQTYDALVDGGAAAQRRGNDRADLGTIAYAATGLIPGASLRAIDGLHPHPSKQELAGLASLAVNSGVLGYEALTRIPKIRAGTEDASGYGSLLAAAGGFVVAHHR